MSIHKDTTELKSIFEKTPIFKGASDDQVAARKAQRVLKRYYFRVELSGVGYDPDEAWGEAIDYYIEDPSGYDEIVKEVPVDPETHEDLPQQGPE